LLGSPYIIKGNVTVADGVTLTIDPGVNVIFDGFYSLFVDGTLLALGNDSNRINISSNSLIPGSWDRIRINSSGHAEIQYTNISYGTYGIQYISSLNNISQSNIMDNLKGIRLDSSHNNSIISNKILSNNDGGIALHSSLFNNISMNEISTDHNENGISLSSSNFNNITSNNLSFNINHIDLLSSSYNNIRNNNIAIAVEGIILQGSIGNNITGNTLCNDLNAGLGINLGGSTGNKIINNNITKFPVGIQFISSSSNDIIDNRISHNWNGIIFDMSSNDNLIMKNRIYNNDPFGFMLELSLRNNIIENDVRGNRESISLYTSSNNNSLIGNNVINNNYGIINYLSSYNKIYHNNFIDNADQAMNYNSVNFWNETYPSGGNYWSDFSPTCQDLYDGALTPQFSGSPDDICDYKYDTDIDASDYYPLTMPLVPLVAPPTNLSAELTGIFLQSIAISWNASLDDPIDVTNYAIYFGTEYDAQGSNYEFLAEVPASGTQRYSYTAASLGKGDPNSYFFVVQANTTFTNVYTKNDTQVAKYSFQHSPGKFLMSIPLELNDRNITKILQTAKLNAAWYFDNSDPVDPWKSYNPAKPYPQSLTTINRTMALWISVFKNSDLIVAGVLPKETEIPLKAGLNFVGYPSFQEKAIADALGGVTYERIEGYDSSSPQNLRVYFDTDIMKPGFGYWIKVPFDQTWIVRN
jgi:parallel beta-helix repeat protein